MSRLRGVCKASWTRKPVRSVQPHEVGRWAGALSREVAPATLNRYLSAVSSVFSWAVTRGFAEENPVRNVRRASEQGNARQIFLSAEQTDAMLDAAPDDVRPLLDCAVRTAMQVIPVSGHMAASIASGRSRRK